MRAAHTVLAGSPRVLRAAGCARRAHRRRSRTGGRKYRGGREDRYVLLFLRRGAYRAFSMTLYLIPILLCFNLAREAIAPGAE